MANDATYIQRAGNFDAGFTHVKANEGVPDRLALWGATGTEEEQEANIEAVVTRERLACLDVHWRGGEHNVEIACQNGREF